MKDRFGLIVFLASLAFLSFAFGIVVAIVQPSPYRTVERHIRNVADTAVHWKNDFGIEPTRYLVPRRDPRPSDAVIRPQDIASGWRIFAGYFRGRSSPAGAILFDEAGEEQFFWPIDPDAIQEELQVTNPYSRHSVLHGFEVLPDGSIVVTFDMGKALARLDACGRIMWAKEGAYHHSITSAGDGTLWVSGLIRDKNGISHVDADTGEVLWSVRFFDDEFLDGDHRGIFQIFREVAEFEPRWVGGDPFHINDVSVLEPELADAFPQFQAGDIMVSVRNPNLVVIFDAETKRAKWWQHGPWHRQHDPDFMPNGRISVFDNAMHGDASRIIEIDPVSRETEVVFEGSPQTPFYTWVMGKHQRLENGNILIVEPRAGRVFEVTEGGDVVWDFHNAYDEDRNFLVTSASVLPPDFFTGGAPVCDAAER